MNNLLIIKDTLIIISTFCGFVIMMSLHEFNKYKNLLLTINILMILFNIEAWVTYYENFPKTENDIDVLNFSVILVSIFFTIIVTGLNLYERRKYQNK